MTVQASGEPAQVDSLPADIAAVVQQLAFLPNQQLWQAARQRVSNEKSERMQTLLLKRDAEGLTETELDEVEQLQHYAHLIMLVRADASVLLKERGYNIDSLRQSSTESK